VTCQTDRNPTTAGTASDGNIYVVAGEPGQAGITGLIIGANTSIAARDVRFSSPWVCARDAQGSIYISDSVGPYKLAADFSTVQFLGQVTEYIEGMAVLANGTLLISSTGSVCRYENSTTCTRVAGDPGTQVVGDGGPAISARIGYPMRLAAHPTDPNVYYVADMGFNRIRMVSNGIITTVAGNGTKGFGGDGGPATSAALNAPKSMSLDAAGNVYIADTSNNRIRWGAWVGLGLRVAARANGGREWSRLGWGLGGGHRASRALRGNWEHSSTQHSLRCAPFAAQTRGCCHWHHHHCGRQRHGTIQCWY
jgi:hypothetical protein